ncbi:MAG: RNA-binding transcriptional accessory protein [Oscillospiraceae bacterium]|nr:RNA-binding transcriptional accessory protein [Oscillospiraceae bacterium]
MEILKKLTEEFTLKDTHIENIISLIDDGNTIPFIARYRKEATGGCDDQVLRELNDRLEYLRNLQKRKQTIVENITAQGKMTDELSSHIEAASTLAALEDIYRPFRQKRRTRASTAREKGLERLADIIWLQDEHILTIMQLASEFIDPEKGVDDVDAAIAGAKDIIAENLADDATLKGLLRNYVNDIAVLSSKNTKVEDSVYRMYYEFSESILKIPSHRILAINRGESEGFLKVTVDIPEDNAIDIMHNFCLKAPCTTTETLKEAIVDSLRRLIFPSLEREIRSGLTETAAVAAIKMFSQNLKPLLLQPPVKANAILAVDPAYRTGCKIAVIDSSGMVLDTTVIYPTPPQNKTEESKETIKQLIAKHGVEVIAIGNGTASKESEIFFASTLREIKEKVSYVMVNEAGASVYSASKLAAKELPNYDVSLRSAVSIARRLLDPLAELVKIDPKAIGVGQYQHDMPQAKLNDSLLGVVEDCVNSVGVDVNTASPFLLSYVSGLSSVTAESIYNYRNEYGKFSSRAQFMKVPKLGVKAFEQAAGFLRITDGENVFDNTSVHPESYQAARLLLEMFDYSELDVKSNNIPDLDKKVQSFGEQKTADSCGVGLITLRDIIQELQKPGRDIRDNLPSPILREDLITIEDLKPGMVLTGTVRNVIDFGAFVDIGVHQDGLVHISRMSDRFIKHPSEIVKVSDVVKVEIISVDVTKKQISLNMKGLN